MPTKILLIGEEYKYAKDTVNIDATIKYFNQIYSSDSTYNDKNKAVLDFVECNEGKIFFMQKRREISLNGRHLFQFFEIIIENNKIIKNKFYI